MIDSIEYKISLVRDKIYTLLDNNNLIQTKGLNFINDDKEKQDYINFILLTLYKELDYFSNQRYTYKQVITNRPIKQKEIDGFIKKLEYINNGLLSYLPIILLEQGRHTKKMYSKIIDDIENDLNEYLDKTKEIIQHINNYKNILNSNRFISFCNFYTREIDQEYVIRNLILRYLCLITQICFGEKYKNKHKLFYDLLIQITGDDWDSFIPEDVKNIVKNINIYKNLDKLKICFEGLYLSMPISDNTNRDRFNDLLTVDSYNNEITKFYELFIFHNQFYNKYIAFKENIGFVFRE